MSGNIIIAQLYSRDLSLYNVARGVFYTAAGLITLGCLINCAWYKMADTSRKIRQRKETFLEDEEPHVSVQKAVEAIQSHVSTATNFRMMGSRQVSTWLQLNYRH